MHLILRSQLLYRSLFITLNIILILKIATIKDVIPRNTLHAGRYRFQYWRDALQSFVPNLSGSSLDNQQPVLSALQVYVPKYKLSVRLLERSLEAR